MGDAAPLVRLEDLRVWFAGRGGLLGRRREHVKAVDGVDLEIRHREALGLVGESGCGKSTTGLAVLRGVEATAGRILFDGIDITALPRAELRALRRRTAMIFQDPTASLNPRLRVGESVAEPLEIHFPANTRSDNQRRVAELFELVGLNPEYRNRYPHQFSGGQQQRIGIARALSCGPDFVVCDEPIASLDVSIQAQILNLLKKLQQELGLTYLFIAHDLAAVQYISDRIAVMYLGKVVEIASQDMIVNDPKHPYTQALLSAVPVADPRRERARERIILEGDVPSPMNPPSACRFHTRCPKVFDPCADVEPPLLDSLAGRPVACHLYDPEHAPRAVPRTEPGAGA